MGTLAVVFVHGESPVRGRMVGVLVVLMCALCLLLWAMYGVDTMHGSVLCVVRRCIVSGDRCAWKQQPGESVRAYQAALAYFRMGMGRSTAALAKHLDKDRGYIQRLSARYRWAERAQEYDAEYCERDPETREAVVREAAEAEAEKWLARVRVAREEEWEVSRDLVAKAREMLSQPLEQTKWSLRDAAKFLELASKLTELATKQYGEEAGGVRSGGDMTVRVEYVDEVGEDGE